MLWTKKYNPKKLADVVGQAEAVNQLREFLQNFSKQRKKALLLYGPSGTGKTSAVYALAYESNLEILEINASDLRNKEQIESVLGNAIKQKSLFHRGKLILVDEIDGLNTMEDRGGISALAKIITETYFPIIMTTTNPFDFKFSSLKNKSKLVAFQAVDHNAIFTLLKKIAENENLEYNETDLKKLARMSGGDIRAAIIDLQILSIVDNKVHSEDIDLFLNRNKIESMINALIKVFKSSDASIASHAFDSVDEDLDSIFLWVEENIPIEYKNARDLANAYDMLSKADVYRGRIKRRNDWRFMVYSYSFLTTGIAGSKEEKYRGITIYKPTGRLLKIWMANQKNLKRKAIAAKLAERTHCSKKEAFKTIPLIKPLFKDNNVSKHLANELDLEGEEVEWLRR